jgi:glycerol uptake facilitator-like aquaporin
MWRKVHESKRAPSLFSNTGQILIEAAISAILMFVIMAALAQLIEYGKHRKSSFSKVKNRIEELNGIEKNN